MNRKPVKCLLVDDITENLLALEGLLRRDDVQLLTAKSGPEALELLLVHEFALAILDVQMPEMDGFELAELMRGAQRTRGIPIVFLTAGGLDERRRFRGYETGAVDFLFKPIEPHVLRSKAEVFFELHRQKLELRELNDRLERRVEERTAELVAANQELEAFTYSVAHDLRAPLRAISATSKILLEEIGETLEADQRHMLIRQAHNSGKLAALIDDLLRLSRIGRQAMRLVTVDISALATAVARDEVGSRMRVEIEPNITLCADPDLIRIVLANLIGNSVKYSPDGGKVHVGRFSEGDREGFFVADEGIGFEMEYVHKIFQPFERLHRDDVYPGSGVGLASVQRIAERHRGQVWAESTPDKGSIFYFAVPRDPTRPLPIQCPESSPSTTGPW